MTTHKVIRRCGTPVMEIVENDNIIFTRFFLTGEIFGTLKPNADPKVKKIYKKYIKNKLIKKGDI